MDQLGPYSATPTCPCMSLSGILGAGTCTLGLQHSLLAQGQASHTSALPTFLCALHAPWDWFLPSMSQSDASGVLSECAAVPASHSWGQASWLAFLGKN